VEALCAVSVALKGRPRVGNLVELTGPENTGDDKSKCNRKKIVMSETLVLNRYIVGDINVGIVPDTLVREIMADWSRERVELIYSGGRQKSVTPPLRRAEFVRGLSRVREVRVIASEDFLVAAQSLDL